MALKRKGILAVPGPYMFGDNQELTIAEELKAAAERQPTIPLTMGHPPECLKGHDPLPEHIIGLVHQKWFGGQNRAIADFMIHEEKAGQVTPDVLEKYKNGKPVGISPGIWRDIDRKDNIMRNMSYTHVALLNDTEDPRCPLGTCGVNLRLDSLSTDGRQREMLLGQKAELKEEIPKEPVPDVSPVVEEKKPAQEPVKEPQHKPVEEKPEVDIPKKEPAQEVQRAPEVIIPVPETTTHHEYEVLGNCWVKYVPKAYRTKEAI